MLDIKRIRQNPEALQEAMRKRRNKGADVSALLALDADRRQVMQEAEALKARRNEVSVQIPKMKKAGEDTELLMAEMKDVAGKIKALDDRLGGMDAELESMLMNIPNIPHESVPEGTDDSDNEEIRRWSEPAQFGFAPKAHWEIGESLNILDFAAAGKITGARFTVYRGLGSRLERSIINYYLDTHTQHGYTEIFPSLYGEPGFHDRHRPAPQVRGGRLQGGRHGLLPDPHCGGSRHQHAPGRDRGR